MSGLAAARRIGLLGGSFDPPHLAHLALGRLAQQALGLDQLRWLPAGAPWQKAGRPITAGQHRVAMLALLVDGAPGQLIDERELQRSGPTYTIDTVLALQAEHAGHAGQGPADPAPAEWFLVIGQDQYARIDTWHRWPELLARVTLAVAGRAGQAPQAPPAVAAVPHALRLLDLPPMGLSASDIRQRCAAGQPVSALVGPAVARYIDQHRLYLPDNRSLSR